MVVYKSRISNSGWYYVNDCKLKPNIMRFVYVVLGIIINILLYLCILLGVSIIAFLVWDFSMVTDLNNWFLNGTNPFMRALMLLFNLLLIFLYLVFKF